MCQDWFQSLCSFCFRKIHLHDLKWYIQIVLWFSSLLYFYLLTWFLPPLPRYNQKSEFVSDVWCWWASVPISISGANWLERCMLPLVALSGSFKPCKSGQWGVILTTYHPAPPLTIKTQANHPSVHWMDIFQVLGNLSHSFKKALFLSNKSFTLS